MSGLPVYVPTIRFDEATLEVQALACAFGSHVKVAPTYTRRLRSEITST
jgi:hypothetical protein